jgi:hypothetical protein
MLVVGRDCEIELRLIALPRAGIPHDMRTGLSYYERYYNPHRENPLRAYSTRPVNLKRLDRMNWMTEDEDLW